MAEWVVGSCRVRVSWKESESFRSEVIKLLVSKGTPNVRKSIQLSLSLFTYSPVSTYPHLWTPTSDQTGLWTRVKSSDWITCHNTRIHSITNNLLLLLLVGTTIQVSLFQSITNNTLHCYRVGVRVDSIVRISRLSCQEHSQLVQLPPRVQVQLDLTDIQHCWKVATITRILITLTPPLLLSLSLSLINNTNTVKLDQ